MPRIYCYLGGTAGVVAEVVVDDGVGVVVVVVVAGCALLLRLPLGPPLSLKNLGLPGPKKPHSLLPLRLRTA